MIKGLSGGEGVTVSAGDTMIPYINPNQNNPLTGMLRINNANIEVFNGSVWQIISTSYATVTLDVDTQDLLRWARKKRDEEIEFERLAETNPTIKDLVEQVKQKQNQIQMVKNLIKKDTQWDESEVMTAGP